MKFASPLLPCLLFVALLAAAAPRAAAAEDAVTPGLPWNDTAGNLINAHGGGVYFLDGLYYWYGEHKIAGSQERKGHTSGGIQLYTSPDLVNWTDKGLVLSVDYENEESDITYGCRLERPKVHFNEKTKKYVAYFKLYLKGAGVRICHVGVATADAPTGPFTYVGKHLVSSENGTGDLSMFFDPVTQKLYHFAVRKTDRKVVRATMSDDGLTPGPYTAIEEIRPSTEGLAIIYDRGNYHLVGSGSSGWKPNPARYYTAHSIDGPWTDRGNPLRGVNPHNGLGPDKSFEGQPNFILPVPGKPGLYVLLMDVWQPDDPITSGYIWLPFRAYDRPLEINWIGRWNLDSFGQ